MRIHSGIPKTFWVNSMINRGSSVPLEFKLSKKVWIGKELKCSHLRIFGCITYVHVVLEKRDMLDTEAVKCYFIGDDSDMFWD